MCPRESAALKQLQRDDAVREQPSRAVPVGTLLWLRWLWAEVGGGSSYRTGLSGTTVQKSRSRGRMLQACEALGSLRTGLWEICYMSILGHSSGLFCPQIHGFTYYIRCVPREASTRCHSSTGPHDTSSHGPSSSPAQEAQTDLCGFCLHPF